MNAQALFSELETLLERLGVTLRQERLASAGPSVRGGLYRRKGKWYCILDSRASVTEKNVILARGLAGMNLHGVYVKPAVREYIDRYIEADAETGTGDETDRGGGESQDWADQG